MAEVEAPPKPKLDSELVKNLSERFMVNPVKSPAQQKQEEQDKES